MDKCQAPALPVADRVVHVTGPRADRPLDRAIRITEWREDFREVVRNGPIVPGERPVELAAPVSVIFVLDWFTAHGVDPDDLERRGVHLPFDADLLEKPCKIDLDFCRHFIVRPLPQIDGCDLQQNAKSAGPGPTTDRRVVRSSSDSDLAR